MGRRVRERRLAAIRLGGVVRGEADFGGGVCGRRPQVHAASHDG